jgi:hypothetical protein
LIDILAIRPKALASAQAFLQTTKPLRELGWGVSGIVFASPSLTSAIKVHHRLDSYLTEVKAYTLLRQHRITSLHGLTIPRMHRHDDRLGLIEMDLVSPPFLLDFAGVKFADPGFSSDTQEDIDQTIQMRFGDRADVAYAVYHSLRTIGMYYLDLRPSNLNVTGLSDLSDTEDGAAPSQS